MQFFDSHGGVRVFGYPISNEMTEANQTVQYFERFRFEYHPQLRGTGNEVQLTRLGVELTRGKNFRPVAARASTARETYIRETGHTLGGAFLQYWKGSGGVRIFGFPISEPVAENGRTVQYFERARMEYHGGSQPVQLGLLTREYLRTRPDIAASLTQSGRVSPSARGEVLPQVQQPAAAPSGLSDKEDALMRLINDARRGAGLGTVSIDPALRNVALGRSRDMVARGYFSHTTPDGVGFLAILKSAGVQYRFAGEILANNNFEDGDTAVAAYNSYMNSPAHRAVLMDARFNTAGVGHAKDSRGFHYFTVLFIQR